MIVDSHCHLDCIDLADHENSLDTLIQKAQANDVEYFLCVCIDLENFPKVLAIAERYPFISASVGVHPNDRESTEASAEELVAFAQHPKIVAIGETGLDFYYHKDDNLWQQERFRQHIRAAVACKKPLIIHTRDARQETIQIMQEEGADRVGGVMHCFTEDLTMAQAAMDLNFYISFSGIVTFKNAKALQEVAQHIPLERMLIETDSPYLAPVPHRGKQNQPAYVKHVAEFIADLRGESYATIAEHTTRNFYRLFAIDNT